MRLIYFCLFMPSICFSQDIVNAERFFTVGLSEVEQVDGPASETVNFPWVDKYEFRTKTRDFAFGKQEYTLRVSPSTGKIRKAQKSLFEELRNAQDFNEQEIYCDLLLSLHIDWLSLFILNEKKSVLGELMVMLNDKQTIYERMVGAYEFDQQKFLKLQTEKSDAEIELNKINLEQEFLLDKYQLQGQEMDFGDFATVETISKYLASSILAPYRDSGFVDIETEHKKRLLIKEIELESSEKNRIFDFVQFRYNGPHTDIIQEKFSLGLGFQLSTSGSKKLKILELEIEKDELMRKSELNLLEKQDNTFTLESELQRDIQAYFHFQQTMEEEREQLQELSSRISQKEGTSPLFLLDIEERHLSMKIKSLNKKEDLLRDFLKYIQQTDQMCHAAFVNYLNL